MDMIETYYKQVVQLQKRCLDFPSLISIETKALCNAACVFCPYPTLDRKGTELDDATIHKIISEIETFPSDRELTVVLARVNETFLDKRWFRISTQIIRAKPNVKFGFFSNGSTIVRKNLSLLSQLGNNVEYLNVSLNYADASTHKLNMGLDFDKVIQNLDLLHEMKSDNLFTPLVVVSRVGDSTDSDRKFREFVEKRFPLFRVKISPMGNWMGEIEVDDPEAIPETQCRQWFQLHILADGNHAFCCIDSKGSYGYGNIKDNTMLELYNHERFRKLREDLPSRSKYETCSNCPLMP